MESEFRTELHSSGNWGVLLFLSANKLWKVTGQRQLHRMGSVMVFRKFEHCMGNSKNYLHFFFPLICSTVRLCFCLLRMDLIKVRWTGRLLLVRPLYFSSKRAFLIGASTFNHSHLTYLYLELLFALLSEWYMDETLIPCSFLELTLGNLVM